MCGRSAISFLIALRVIASPLSALGADVSGFDLRELPVGNEVTMPQPATTLAPPVGRVQLTSTERNQSLKFSAVNVKGKGTTRPIKLAIYSRSDERVQNITVHPGSQAIYKIPRLGSIGIIQSLEGPDADKAEDQGLRLMIESDKPLTVQRGTP